MSAFICPVFGDRFTEDDETACLVWVTCPGLDRQISLDTARPELES